MSHQITETIATTVPAERQSTQHLTTVRGEQCWATNTVVDASGYADYYYYNDGRQRWMRVCWFHGTSAAQTFAPQSRERTPAAGAHHDVDLDAVTDALHVAEDMPPHGRSGVPYIAPSIYDHSGRNNDHHQPGLTPQYWSSSSAASSATGRNTAGGALQQGGYGQHLGVPSTSKRPAPSPWPTSPQRQGFAPHTPMQPHAQSPAAHPQSPQHGTTPHTATTPQWDQWIN